MIAIAIALPVGIWLPDVLGGGSNLIDTAEHARVGLGMLCLLFVAKMLFTSTSFGSGAPWRYFHVRFLRSVRWPAASAVKCCIDLVICHPTQWRCLRCA